MGAEGVQRQGVAFGGNEKGRDGFFCVCFFLLFLFYNMLYKNQNDAGDKEN